LDPLYNHIIKVVRHTPFEVTEFAVCKVKSLLFLFTEVAFASVRVADTLSLVSSDETLSGILTRTNIAAVTLYNF